MTREQMSFGGIVSGTGMLLCIPPFVSGVESVLPIGVAAILAGMVIEAVSQHAGMRR